MIKILMSTETYNSYGQSKINKEIIDDTDTYKSNDYKTALFLAIENKYYDIVQLLLSSEKECSVNEESELNYTHETTLNTTKDKFVKLPIHLALENNDNKMLELLLTSNEIDVNIDYKLIRNINKEFDYTLYQTEKKTPLHIAIEKDNVDAVRLLLSHKSIDVNKPYSFKLDKKRDGYDYDEDNQGNEEEELPGDNERDKQVRFKKTALHLAVEKNKIEIVKLLLSHSKIDVNCREKYQLIKPLLKIDTHKTSLQIAIEKKEIEIVKLLFEKPSISINEQIPYKYDKYAKTIQRYSDENEENASKNDKNDELHEYCLKTPLHAAVQTGCIGIIKLLLQQKSINTQIDDGQGKYPKDYTENAEIKSLFE